MVPPGEPRSGPTPWSSARIPLLLAAVLTLVLGTTPVSAQPAPPDTAQGAAEQLEQVQADAERLTEQWHAAKDELGARQEEVDAMQAAAEPARLAAEAARAEEDRFRAQVDVLTLSVFESGNLDQFNALLASGSPQDFLDQMSMLEMLASDQRIVLDELIAVVEDTGSAQADADAAAARAQAATDAAIAAERDLETRKREAETRIEEAEALLARLDPQARADRIASDAEGPDGPIAGSGAGAEAVRAAITQLGQPYEWAAAGPNSYDCSGLIYWAFAQAGVTIPRSSSQQALMGREVPPDEIRAGDLVYFYSPVSHVGLAVDGETMINAPQTGDVVKYASFRDRDLVGARRL